MNNINLIRCPITHEELGPCPPGYLDFANREQSAGRLFSQLGLQIENPVSNGLVNESQTFLIRVESGIPILISDELIPIDHFDESEF